MYHVLLMTDFSPASHYAITFAQSLFAGVATEFTLLNTRPPRFSSDRGRRNELEAARRSLRRLERSVSMQSPDCGRFTYRTLVLPGDPAPVVAELLNQEPVDLVVLGATGADSSTNLGHVAAAMMQPGNTRILLVPMAGIVAPVRHVVLATGPETGPLLPDGLLDAVLRQRNARLTRLLVKAPTRPGASTALPYHAQTTDYCLDDDSVLHGIDLYIDDHPVDLLVLPPHSERILSVAYENATAHSVVFRLRVPLLLLAEPTQAARPVRPSVLLRGVSVSFSPVTRSDHVSSHTASVLRNALDEPYVGQRTGTGPLRGRFLGRPAGYGG